MEHLLNDDNNNQQLVFHCSCPGCIVLFYLTVWLIGLVLFLVVSMVLLWKRPSVPVVSYDYCDDSSDSNYEGIQDTSL